METEYAALYPEQIKSAVGNNGNFDPRDANIYHQRLSTALSSDPLFARQWSSTAKDLDDIL